MCAPQVTRHTSVLYSSSCHTRINICAVNIIDALVLTRVWQELEYRIDVCRVTRSAHIERL
jgi:hypothetical protein